jgi:hypothetical protein
MKNRRKNPHAVALGRLGGLVRSEAKRRANRENGRKGGLVKSRKKRIAAGETPDARGRRGAGRRGERGDLLDSGPFRPSRYRPGLWRNPLFGERAPLNPSVGWTQSRGDGSPFNCPYFVRVVSESLPVVL